MYFVKRGSTLHPTDEADLDIHKALPPGNFIIKEDMFGRYFFEGIDDFQLPDKLYGDTAQLAERILRTYNDRPGSTGVMLSGEKGSGKTLLAKVISHISKSNGWPTVVINTAFFGDKFNSLIQAIDQPCIVLFDEFEKVYDNKQQREMLTLLDVVYPTKKLFLFTINDKWGIDTHLNNRPGRIFYALEYKGLDHDFIAEYCNEKLKEPLKAHIAVLCQISTMFLAFNFDMLQAIVEEMNRYDESPQEALKFVNASPVGENGQSNFAVALMIGGKEIPADDLDSREIEVNPLNIRHKLYVEYEIEDIVRNKKTGKTSGSKTLDEVLESDNAVESRTMYAEFTSDDLKRVDTSAGKFIFINSSKEILTLTKIKKEFSYQHLLA
jgi:hypothetical protein